MCSFSEANILCMDCLQDGSLAVCATADGKIHVIIDDKLNSQVRYQILSSYLKLNCKSYNYEDR